MGNNPLKIFFVSRDKFPPFRVDVAVLFGREMARKNHRIDLVLQSDADCKCMYETQWPAGNAWVGPTNNGQGLAQRFHKHLLGFFHNIRCTKHLISRYYDCIQIKDRFISAIIYLAIAKVYKIKYIYWLSYPFAEESLFESRTGTARYPIVYFIRGSIYKLLLYNIILKHADHVFVQSNQMKIDICSEGIDSQKVTPIPMGFNPDQFTALPDFNDQPDEESPLKVIYLGTLIKLRRLDFLIRMFALVVKQVPKAKLYFIGKGEKVDDISFLQDEARKYGIQKSIVFTGFMERDRALQMIRSASVCVSPFYPTPILNSTSPTKLVEYMALAKAVVANDHPEQRLVITESGGGICVPYRESDFADAVIYLLTHPDENRRMAEKGKAWIFQNRTYSKIADLVEATYYQKIRFS